MGLARARAGAWRSHHAEKDAVTDVIEVFADVVCPFTHVGLKRLIDHRSRIDRPDVGLRLRAWPLELVNGEPLPRDLLEEEIASLRRSVAPDLFVGFDPRAFPMTSLPALALAAHAYRVDLRTGEQVSRALRVALFEEGRDVSDPAELRRIGDSFGLDEADDRDRAAVLEDHVEGRARGVIGSPHFFVRDQAFFCPSLDIQRIDDHLEIAFDEHHFAEFMDSCFNSGGVLQ